MCLIEGAFGIVVEHYALDQLVDNLISEDNKKEEEKKRGETAFSTQEEEVINAGNIIQQIKLGREHTHEEAFGSH